jgi:hypothetical protein
MLLLGTAYALIAEGPVTQSLFNHDFLKMHMHLLDHAYIPAWGIGVWWTLFMLNLHTFWSMGVSIALVEALFSAEAETPWLGLVGDSTVAVVFVLGSAANFGIGWKQNQFVASHAQLLSVAGLSVLLIVSASLMPTRRTRIGVGMVPSPWITGAIAFVLGLGVLYTPPSWGWGAVGAVLALDAVFLAMVEVFSRRPDGVRCTRSVWLRAARLPTVYTRSPRSRCLVEWSGCASATRSCLPLRCG